MNNITKDDVNIILQWIKNATKEERHNEVIEEFAKKHPIIFSKFHMLTRKIVSEDVDSKEYIKAKEKLTKLFRENEDDFKPIFDFILK